MNLAYKYVSAVTHLINVINVHCILTASSQKFFSKEVYGDPEVSPQSETYLGRVNTIGPRACYDEGKRAAEALMSAFHKQAFICLFLAKKYNFV